MDWSQLRAAAQRCSPDWRRLRRFRDIESWLAQPSVQALAHLASVPAGEERDTYQALACLRLKLQRDEAAAAPAQRQPFLDAIGISLQLSAALAARYPELALPPAPAEAARQELLRELTALNSRAQQVVSRAAPGVASPELASDLEQVLAEYGALAGRFGPGNPAYPDLCFFMASVAWALAKSLVPLGRYGEVAGHLEKGAGWYEVAGMPKDAAECRDFGAELARRRAGDLDAATRKSLEDLQAQDPKASLRGLLALVQANTEAGGAFEAGRDAERAAGELVRLGYPDPEAAGRTGFESVLEAWITTAIRDGAPGQDPLAAVVEIVKAYATVLGARVSANLTADPGRAERLDELLKLLSDYAGQMFRVVAEVDAEAQVALAGYVPQSASEAVPPSEDPGLQVNRLAGELLDLQTECNRLTAAGLPTECLISEVARLEKAVEPLRVPWLTGRACLVRAYIHLQAGRGAPVLDAALQAQAAILNGRPPGLASLTESAERGFYLEARARQAQASLLLEDPAAALACCQETIRDVEVERARVSSPYQQSAWIASAVDSYTWGAVAAFRSGCWNDLLALTDLVKAHASLRARPLETAPDLAGLIREFQLLDLQPGNAARRRELWELITVREGQAAAEVPHTPLTVQSVQQLLAYDETVVEYFWFTDSKLLLMVISRGDFCAGLIQFSEDDQATLRALLDAIETMQGSSRGLDSVIAKLGATLLPPWCRETIAGRRRLIFIPHRSLHLFPFQAVAWDDEPIGVRFGVRYAPNLASLGLARQGFRSGGVLAVGVPDCRQPGYPLLPEAATEVLRVAEIYRERGVTVDVLLGDEATRENLRALASRRYSVVHLATHGESVLRNAPDPLESKLMLCGDALDGLDITYCGFRAELAVLSACSSGQRALRGRDSAELPGDDIFGLQMALFHSGVRTILGTLWPVETHAALAIVTEFHRQYAAGLSAELALQAAVTEFRRLQPGRKACCYWAPFFLISIGSMREE
jgi:hypothetical protein